MLLKIELVLYRCFWQVLMTILCAVVHALCIYASKLLSGFFGTRSGFFGEGRLVTLLCSLARFDLAYRGVRQPVQRHTYARLLVFDVTLAQPHFAVVNCSDAVMSVFYSPFSTRRRICTSCQQTSPKRWFGYMNVTSDCDITKTAHHKQMTTICHWMNSPMKIFCVRHWVR